MPGPAAVPRTATRVPLGRTFWTVWSGQTVSTVGSTLAAVGVAVHIYATTGSVTWLGVLMALAALPSALVTPALGLVDRLDRRHLMIAADLLAATGPAVALVLALLGRLEVHHLLAAGFIAGLGNALQFPAYQAAIPDLVPREALGRANGVVQLAPALGVVLGPAAASALLVTWGIEAVLLADLVSCGAGVTATWLARFRSRPVPAESSGGATTSRGAWRWLRTTGRPLLVLVGLMAMVNLALAMFNVSALALATDLGGQGRAGWAPAIGGAGMIVASLVLARTGVPARRVAATAASIGGIAVGVALTAVRPAFGLVVAGVAVAMAAVPLANASVATMFHERVPHALHGRVFGLRAAIGRGLEPLGSLLSGLLVVSVANPVLSDGAAGTVARSLVGDGPGRDTALLALAVAAGLGMLAWRLVRHPGLATLDAAEVPVETVSAQEALELVGARLRGEPG